jgi:hypothetical protein
MEKPGLPVVPWFVAIVPEDKKSFSSLAKRKGFFFANVRRKIRRQQY